MGGGWWWWWWVGWGGGDGEVENWPLLSACKSKRKKKWGGREKRKKGNRSHTGYASRLNCICAPTVGEQAQHGQAWTPSVRYRPWYR